jgi:hypothetical protein
MLLPLPSARLPAEFFMLWPAASTKSALQTRLTRNFRRKPRGMLSSTLLHKPDMRLLAVYVIARNWYAAVEKLDPDVVRNDLAPFLPPVTTNRSHQGLSQVS